MAIVDCTCNMCNLYAKSFFGFDIDGINRYEAERYETESSICEQCFTRSACWIRLYQRLEPCEVLVHRQEVVVERGVKYFQFLVHIRCVHRGFESNLSMFELVLKIADHQTVIECGNKTQ